ncbi:MAG: hypothetical protein J7K40_14505 [candidate division Zixibacteria bacterium]|nr:hypothetical protein [candidate division Zixibacteria bacterium]
MPIITEVKSIDLKIALEIHLSQMPIFGYSDDACDVQFYGNIYNLDTVKAFEFSRFDKQKFIELLNNISGFFIAVVEDKAAGIKYLANDIFGNFRIYYYENKTSLFISDNWQMIVNKVKDEHGKLVIDKNEKYYFSRHHYTTGGRTFIKHVDKMPPASIYTISAKGLNKEIYFKKGITKSYNDSYYRDKNFELISENIRRTIQAEYKNILFFSGGIDSTYLAVSMQNKNILFTPVFIKYIPCTKSNIIDKLKAAAIAKILNMKLEIIETPLTDNLNLLDKPVRRHPFDRAFSINIEYAVSKLYEKYGSCNIINGQSSDNIYCWGPSSKTVGNFIQRIFTSEIYFKRSMVIKSLMSAAAKQLYHIKWNTNIGFKIPTTNSDYWVGMLDPQGYLPFIHTDKRYLEYQNYLSQIAEDTLNCLNRESETARMYFKLMTYLQGPDNISFVESCRAYSHNPVHPFVDARIVYLKMRYQKELKNLFQPRYVLEELLRERFKFDAAIITKLSKQKVNSNTEFEFESLTKKIYKQWDKISAKLL